MPACLLSTRKCPCQCLTHQVSTRLVQHLRMRIQKIGNDHFYLLIVHIPRRAKHDFVKGVMHAEHKSREGTGTRHIGLL